MNMKTNNEPRYEGANWDEPVVNLAKKGKRKLMRKVKTRGVEVIHLAGLLTAIRDHLRKGYEVRLTDAGDCECFRIFHLVDTSLKRMKPCVQVMGPALNWLADKKVRVSNRGREISKAETAKIVSRYKEGVKERNMAFVTPDTVVECPKCGTKFRVGRPQRDAA